MNPGLAIFKKRQRLQGGTEEVPPWLKAGYEPQEPGSVWTSPSGVKKVASAKEASGLYAPQEMSEQDQQRARTASNEANMSELQKARESTFSTIGMKIGDREWEVPTTWDEMPEDIMWWVHNQPREQWPDRVIEAIENNARDLLEQGIHPLTGYKVDDPRNQETPTPQQHARGTSNVQYLQGGDSGLNYDPSYPGPTNPKESGSGYWTQKGVGTGVGIASNFIFPGLGLLTGPLASWAMRAMQSGMAQNAVQQAVQNYQQQAQQASDRGEAAPAVPDDPTGVSSDRASHHAGVGIDPEGNPADPGEWWSNDFGRWNTDKGGGFPGELGGNTQGGPGLSYGHFGTGFGSGTVGNWGTAIGFGGNLGGGGINFSETLGSGALARHAMEVLAKTGYVAPTRALVGGAPPGMLQGTQAGGYQGNIVNPAAFGGSSSAGQSIHFRPHTEAQMGTSNVGLDLFRRKQMLRNKKP